MRMINSNRASGRSLSEGQDVSFCFVPATIEEEVQLLVNQEYQAYPF
jgi:hypothetical protein